MDVSTQWPDQRGCAIRCSMELLMFDRLGWVAILCALAGAAQATSLRVSAEPPLSGERLGDALRSYLDGAEVTIEPSPGAADGASAAAWAASSVRRSAESPRLS